MFRKIIFVVLLVSVLVFNGCSSTKFVDTSEIKAIAKQINENFSEIEIEMDVITKEFSSAISSDIVFEEISEEYKYSKYGMLYNPIYINNSSAVLTGYKTIDKELKEKLYKSKLVENKFIDIYNKFAEIDQVYVSDKNGLLRIFPGIDILINILPKENFYEFDFHNLENETFDEKNRSVWINKPYIDPFGIDCIISLIGLSFNDDDELVGIIGFNLIIDNLRKQYLKKNMFLVSSDGYLIMCDSSLNNLFEIGDIANPLYYEPIMEEKYLSECYNLSKNKNILIRFLFEKILQTTEGHFNYEADNKYIVVVEKIDIIDSYLVELIIVN